MADKKISQLTALSAANVAPATDVLAIVDTSATETKKITAKDLIDGALNGGTANGVLYLNGSKVATSGSNLTYSGTTLSVKAGNGDQLILNNAGERFTQLTLQNNGVTKANLNFDNTNSLVEMYGVAGTSLIFSPNAAEKMRLTSSVLSTDSSISVGIGTASPGATLDVAGNARSNAWIGRANGSAPTADAAIYRPADNSLGFSTANTLRATIDSSGNLGLGVTPSAWRSLETALQYGGVGALSSYNSITTNFRNNCFINSSNEEKYIANGYALIYSQNKDTGVHAWLNAGSGTAGNTISFGDPKMTLDASGNLGVGVTSPGRRLSISATSPHIQLCNSTTGTSAGDGFELAIANSDAYIIQRENAPMLFYTNDTERGRFTAGGKFLVGTTSNAFDGNLLVYQATATNDTISIWNAATSGDNQFIEFYTEGDGTGRGSIDYNRAGGLVRYNTTSDYRAKDVYALLDDSGETIDALKVYRGKMHGATMERPMLIAHEAQEVAPYAVTGEKDAVNDDGDPIYQQMDTSSLVPLLIAEIQSLRSRVSALEAQ